MTNIRRSASLALATAAAAVAVAAPSVAGGAAPSHSRTLADYCLNVGPVYYQDKTVYPGGLYCVPFPGA